MAEKANFEWRCQYKPDLLFQSLATCQVRKHKAKEDPTSVVLANCRKCTGPERIALAPPVEEPKRSQPTIPAADNPAPVNVGAPPAEDESPAKGSTKRQTLSRLADMIAARADELTQSRLSVEEFPHKANWELLDAMARDVADMAEIIALVAGKRLPAGQDQQEGGDE